VIKTNKAINHNSTNAYNQIYHVSCFILLYEVLKHGYKMLISKWFYFYCLSRSVKYIVTTAWYWLCLLSVTHKTNGEGLVLQFITTSWRRIGEVEI